MGGRDEYRDSNSREEKYGLLDEQIGSSSEIDSDSDIFEAKHQQFGVRNYRLPLLGSAGLRYIRSVPWRNLIIRLLIFLTPSFFQGRHAREQIRPAKLSPTAYLDGMRGLAALVVFFCHYFYQAFIIAEGWGSEETNYHFLKLPFFRLWYQGPPAVCLFFVISGYALSYRPLKFVRSRAVGDFSTTISSLVFRRAIRLYLPTAISTFMIVCLLRLEVYEWTREFANDRTYMKNIVENHPKRMESAYAQWMDWLWHMFRFFHVFGWEQYGGSTCECFQIERWMTFTFTDIIENSL